MQFDVSHFLPYRPIGSRWRSSAALLTRRSRPAHRALDRRSDCGLAWTAHYHFRARVCEQHSGDHRRLELGLQANIAGEPQSPTAGRADGKFGCHSGAALLRSGAGMTPIWAAFQQPALAVSAAPTMSNGAAKAATAGVSEACAMREAAADIMGEAAAHPMSEPVVEIARRARIVRSVAPVIG